MTSCACYNPLTHTQSGRPGSDKNSKHIPANCFGCVLIVAGGDSEALHEGISCIFCTRSLACSAFKFCLVSCPQVANSTATPHNLGRSLERFMTANTRFLTTDTFLIYLEIVPSMATLLDLPQPFEIFQLKHKSTSHKKVF